jgi:hypothetical protein
MEAEMKKRLVLAVILLTSLSFNLPASANTVVVIPLGGGTSQPLANIVTVAKQNGDFANPRDAVNSITDASEENPYLIVIAPGRYQVSSTINMKPYVSITGSGEKVTTIWGEIGTISATHSAILRGASNATLSNISIENDGPALNATFAIGIVNVGDSLHMNNVRVDAFGGPQGASNIRGVYNISSSLVMINNCVINAVGTGAIGLYNGSPVLVQNSYLRGSFRGLYIGHDATRIKNTYIELGVNDTFPGSTQCRETYDFDFTNVDC